MAKSNLKEIVVARVFKHAGANYAMQNRIREAQQDGLTVAECAMKLNVEPNCVASFYEHFQPSSDTEAEPEEAAVAKPAPARKKAPAKSTG